MKRFPDDDNRHFGNSQGILGPGQNYGGMGPNPNQFNMGMMNPAMIAAALGSWNQMLTGMMGNGQMPPGGAKGGAGGRGQDGGKHMGWNNNRGDNMQKGSGWQYNPQYDH